MVDAVRAALRLLPVPRPGPCGRAARAHQQARAEQAVLGSLAPHPHTANCDRHTLHRVSGLARFARAFLSYVGVGVSVVAASQLAGISVVHAREVSTSPAGGSGPSMAAAEARALWQRSSMSRHYLAQEDILKAQKAVRGSSPAVPEAKSEYAAKRGGEASHLFASSNYWMALDAHYSSEVEWPLTSYAGKHFRPEYLGSGSEYLVCHDDDVSKPWKSASEPEEDMCAEGMIVGYKSTGGYWRNRSDYGDASQLELQWQLAVEPQLKAKPLSEDLDNGQEQQVEELECSPDEGSDPDLEIAQQGISNEDGNHNLDCEEKTRQLSCSTTTASPADEVLGGRQAGSILPHASPVSELALKDRSVAVGDEEDGPHLQLSNLTWRTARKDELAALVAQKAGGQLENCDLPIPLSTSRIKPHLESCKLGTKVQLRDDMCRSMDGKLLASLLQGHEPTRLDHMGLPPSPLVLGTSDPMSVPVLGISPIGSHPLPIPLASRRNSQDITSSTDNRNTSWHGGGAHRAASESGLLGHALCHSQTRAREAEKAVRKVEQAAEQVLKEKQQLVHMFFREASSSLTYRQWVSVLEAENFCLRIYARNHSLWVQESIFNPFTAVERLSKNRWRSLGRDYAKRHMQHHFSGVWHRKGAQPSSRGSHIMMGYTLGLAFALGLGLAGAGLMLGWSMGWILLTY